MSKLLYDHGDVVIYDGKLWRVISTWSDSKPLVAPTMPRYLLADADDYVTERWILEDAMSHPTRCAECNKPLLSDYLCAACREIQI